VVTDSLPGVSATAAVETIVALGFTDVVMIPDSESAALHDRLLATAEIAVLSPAREGEGVAIAAGLWTGGRKPLLVIQNTGVMEAGDTIRGCGIGPRIPLRMLVGWRGYSGAVAGRDPIDSAYPLIEPLLEAWDIPTCQLMSDDDLGVLGEMDRVAQARSRPAAVLSGWAFRP
jgi:sulfopyruvate decarboxylase subunit alpha